jgi:predicted DNA-binding transcriptional regulator AlpA
VERVRRGLRLRVDEVALILRCSKRTVWRLVKRGKLRRCEGITGIVLFEARDVQRLTSARKVKV